MKYIKGLLIAIIIVLYFITSVPFTFLIPLSKYGVKKNILSRIISFYCKIAFRILNIKVETVGDFKLTPGSVVVSNHVTYLDMMLLCTLFKLSFISTVEVLETPFFGRIAQAGGCIFIERRNKDQLDKEVSEVTDHLKNGVSMAFFPEAKATQGVEVLRFRRPFFAPALELGSDIFALTTNYISIDGEPVTAKNKNKVFWYRQNPMIDHILQLLSVKEVKVRVESTKLSAAVDTSEHIADHVHNIVNKRFKPIL